MNTKRLKIVNCYAVIKSECTHKNEFYNVGIEDFSDGRNAINHAVDMSMQCGFNQVVLHHHHSYNE